MATRADYRCEDCGEVREFAFDGTPPPVHTARCCVAMRDRNGVIDDVDHSRFVRKWGPVSIGAVAGAGGSPAR